MSHVTLQSHISALFAGGTGLLGEEGHRSGIFKSRQDGPISVLANGIVGDVQADTRVHGGPEKAVHHFAQENYLRLRECFPQRADQLVAGSLGENLSTCGLDEKNVHIGDVFRAGSVLLQVSQPRSPCWKINHRFDAEGMSLFVAQQRITGWYYRVLEEGTIHPGDAISLVDRTTDRFSIDVFWLVQSAHRPDLGELERLISVPGLSGAWKVRLSERLAWIRKRVASS